MRDPTTSTAAAEKVHERDAVEKARVHLYWVLKSDRGWADSRWVSQDPYGSRWISRNFKDDWEQGFHHALEIARDVINDPACDSLLHKHARFPGAREAIAAALSRARPQSQKKGELRKQTNVLRDQWIAEAVALTCRDGLFLATRNKDAKPTRNRRPSGCSIVAEALRQLEFKGLSESRVAAIWDKYKRAYEHLLGTS